ncbi:orotate phosphoribosyltransferase [Limimonas halophila]|uniref:Orotate phosphoribosyltransferase n=1 Tax=Limimonas halophila TaxID=1082479 RepID=A0A1G7T0P3_9PROT|nr:orotate phosphoribosyltransferase [Limimonas halophila]SDG28604.1 orotate phosphoribosyltransferase [Limimonas halophila]
MQALTPQARTTASILLEIGAVLFSPDAPFTFTSGRRSPVYVDCRAVMSYPRARAKLMALGRETIEEGAGYACFDAVAGGETAGIPFAAWLAERMGLPMVYVRKKPKGFGRDARIEGHLRPGARVLLVEDLATDGGSKAGFVDALHEAGATVEHAFVLFHYGIFPESTRVLADRGVQLHALATWWDTVAVAEEQGYLDAQGLATVRDFLNDPDAWSAAHGGPDGSGS